MLSVLGCVVGFVALCDVDDGLHESFLECDECFEAGVVVESDAAFNLIGELSADAEKFDDDVVCVWMDLASYSL